MSSIRIRSEKRDQLTEIRLLITHPMENGRNRNSSGELIPAHFIEELSVKLNDLSVLNLNMAGSVAKNPFFSFRLKNLQTGDRITVSWLDNRQLSNSAEHIIP